MEYVEPIWSPEKGWNTARCAFCGKEAQHRFYSSISNKYFDCDCDAFTEYKNVYNECTNKLSKLTSLALIRKQIWDRQTKLDMLDDEINTMKAEVRSKQWNLNYDKEDQERQMRELIKRLKINEDEV